MPFIVPHMTTKLLRGEMPEIHEVEHDPNRGWLDPEFEDVDDAEYAMWLLLDAYQGAFLQSPFYDKYAHLKEQLHQEWGF